MGASLHASIKMGGHLPTHKVGGGGDVWLGFGLARVSPSQPICVCIYIKQNKFYNETTSFFRV